MPPAVTIMPSPAMTSVPAPIGIVTAGWMSGLPALPIFQMRPSFMPMSALTMPQWSTISALVMTVSATCARHALALPHAVADHLAAAELHFLAVDGEVLLDLDPQLGVGEAHAVAGGGAEHLGIGLARDLRHFELSHDLAVEAVHLAVARERHQLDGARLAGLEAHRRARRDVRAGSRTPASRSKRSASLVSKKW